VKRIRNLGLAVFAALALTAAVGATGVSASGFVSDSGYTTISGTPYGEGVLSIVVGPWKCNSPAFAQVIKNQANPLTTTALKDAACGTPTLKTNGCQLSFRPGAETSPGNFGGTIDIGPAGCGPMSLTVSGCTTTIGAQSGLNATFENVGSGEKAVVYANLNSGGLKYSVTGKSGCPVGSFTGGWTTTWLLTAFNEAGALTGLHVVKNAGVYMAGEKSEEAAKQPKLNAEKYPVSLLGSQTTALSFGVNAGSAKCSTIQFDGKLAAASAEQSLNSEYSGCTVFGFGGTIASNGCQYVLHVLNSGPPYTGTADIACPAGKSIEIVAKLAGVLKCKETISSQSGLEGVTFSTVGAGSERGVEVKFNLAGIKYTQTAGEGAGSCKSAGAFSDGTLTGATTLYDMLR
jgi:hypothetical protein